MRDKTSEKSEQRRHDKEERRKAKTEAIRKEYEDNSKKRFELATEARPTVQKVEEAKETRNNTVSWIKNTTEQLIDLPSDGSSIRLIHNAWKEMENRSHEMLATDLRYLADFLNHLL